jgi:uncharacterized membrane protein HdeD (DUF308 family)
MEKKKIIKQTVWLIVMGIIMVIMGVSAPNQPIVWKVVITVFGLVFIVIGFDMRRHIKRNQQGVS